MATIRDREEAARAARDTYQAAYQHQLGTPLGPRAELYQFYDEGTGMSLFFKWGDHHVAYVKLAQPRPIRGYGPRTWIDHQVNLFDLRRDPRAIQEIALHVPREITYGAIFDMTSPTWSIPVQEWPVLAQASSRVSGWVGAPESPCPWSGTTYPLYG